MSNAPRVRRISGSDDLRLLFDHLGLLGRHVIVKPNWFSLYPGNYTDASILDLVLTALSGPATVVESYTCMRHDGSREITRRNARSHWDWLRQQDAWFLETTGIGAVLERHGARYVNVTEEVWLERVVPQTEIRARVESRYGEVDQPDLCGYVPLSLFELAGSPLLSLGRLKGSWSLSLKNLFGLIPDPLRDRWHGPGDRDLARSIVNINLIYQALFEAVGMVETFAPFALYRDGGQYHTPWGDYDLIPAAGVAFAGTNLPAVDAAVAHALGARPEEIEYLRMAEARGLGAWADGLQVQVPPELLAALTGQGGGGETKDAQAGERR
ncbi:MAG: DUF362 domain-containing protein [Anaerolineae bacterium]|nr:DUF362 domain-containing protein [Anaerolineae bacterium]